MQNDVEIVFFSSSNEGVIFLERLNELKIVPALLVTLPDKKVGRGRKLQENPTAMWAKKHDVEVVKIDKLDDNFVSLIKSKVDLNKSLFFVYSFGKIIPEKVFSLPKYKTLNYHPSLLPKLRGPSPIASAILYDRKSELGSTIIQIDKKMDHGPILVQNKINLQDSYCLDKITKILSQKGAEDFSKILSDWINGALQPESQKHEYATFTKFFTKKDALINLHYDPYKNYLKFCAFKGWIDSYFIFNGLVVKIKEAEFKSGRFIIKEVIPAGKKQMSFKDFYNGFIKNKSNHDTENLYNKYLR